MVLRKIFTKIAKISLIVQKSGKMWSFIRCIWRRYGAWGFSGR